MVYQLPQVQACSVEVHTNVAHWKVKVVSAERAAVLTNELSLPLVTCIGHVQDLGLSMLSQICPPHLTVLVQVKQPRHSSPLSFIRLAHS